MSNFIKDEMGFIKEVSEEKKKCIIEEYNINGDKYSIAYLEDSKAVDVFNALNRMIVSGKDMDAFGGISINKLFTPAIISMPIKKSRWF